MVQSIHQLLSVFDERDAQGNMALLLQGIFRGWGLDSEIYAELSDPGRKNGILPADSLDLPGDPSDILIYHSSIGSPAGEIFRRTFRSQVMIYHNITPAEFFCGYDELTYLECARGRRGLKKFLPTCDLALADSSFNAGELKDLGFRRVEVLPFPLDRAKLSGPVDEEVRQKFGDDGWTNLLFVGRLAPNKKQDDVIRTFAAYHKQFNPKSRLFLVGATHIPEYEKALLELKEELALDHLYLTGNVSWNELRAYYRIASIFLCLSEHEGFCVPLLESLYYGIPIVAYEAGAVPETLGGAGVLLTEKRPLETAALIDKILSDQDLKERLLKRQKERLTEIENFPYEQKLKEFLQPLL